MTRTLTTRLDEDSVRKIDDLAARRGTDRSALLRAFLLASLKEETLRMALEDVRTGKMTLWEAARRCDLSLWEMVREVQARHVRLPYGLRELDRDLAALDG